jgi:hypothetical protein
MPTELECQSCHLFFSLGWYHYHSFSSGYASMRRLVCGRCGTMHAIEHAVSLASLREAVENATSLLAQRDIDESTLRSADLPSKQKPDRLLAQPGPAFINVEERASLLRQGSFIDERLAGHPQPADWIECRSSPDYRCERTVRAPLVLEGCTDHLSLEGSACNSCKQTGTLVSDWPEGVNCPLCDGQINKTLFWVT